MAESKLTPVVTKKLVQALGIGNYTTVACRFAGIKPSLFWSWMKRGELEVEGVYFEFREKILLAEAASEVSAVGAMRRAMKNDWKAAAEFLARKYPSRWGKNSTVDVHLSDGREGAGSAAREDHLPDLSDEQLEIFAQQLAQVESIPLVEVEALPAPEEP